METEKNNPESLHLIDRLAQKETAEEITDWEAFKKDWLTLKEASELIDLSERYIRNIIRDEGLSSKIFIGGQLGHKPIRCISKMQILAWFQAKTSEQPQRKEPSVAGTEFSRVSEEVNGLKEDLKKIFSQLADLKVSQETISKLRELQQKPEAPNLKPEIDKVSSDVTNLKEYTKEVSSQLAYLLKAQDAAKKEEAPDLKPEIERVSKDVSGLKEGLKAISSHLTEIEKAHDSQQAHEIPDLKPELDNMSRDVNSLKEGLKTLTSHLDALEKYQELSQKQEILDFKPEIDTVSSEVSHLKEDLQAVSSQLADLKVVRDPKKPRVSTIAIVLTILASVVALLFLAYFGRMILYMILDMRK